MRIFTALAVALSLAPIAPIAFGGMVFADSRAPAYQVIVNPNNPSTSADREFVADAFLKKTTSWPNGETIRPVDLGAGSSVRRQFSDEILRRSVAEVKGYWQQRIFSGRDVPPPELDSDDDVVRYVLKYDGAIGYVSGGANLNGAKVLGVH
jgi:ABC-type phosphate transport system substrate-binding protein